MPLPRALGRFNRRVTNPLLWPLVSRLPGFGRVVHVGRRSGRRHRTPILAFRRGDRVVVALTYGPEADWVLNVLATGEARLETRSGSLTLIEPRRFRDPSARVVPALARPALRLLRSPDFLELRVADGERHRLTT